MKETISKILTVLFSYPILCLVTIGSIALIQHRIQYNGEPPEMVGWVGAFWLIGSIGTFSSLSGLVLIFAYAIISKMSTKIFLLFSPFMGIISGFVVYFSMLTIKQEHIQRSSPFLRTSFFVAVFVLIVCFVLEIIVQILDIRKREFGL